MYQENRFLRGIYQLSEWITRFFYANVLWILFALAGFGIFGFIPSTVALFAIARKWVLGESDIPLLRTFWSIYCKEFFKVNLFGFILLLIGFFLYWDIKILRSQESMVLQLASFLILGLLLIYIIIILYMLPVFVHYDLKFIHNMRFSFAVAFTHPFWTLLIILAYILTFLSILKLPSLFPFFSGSLLAYAINWIAYRLFTKIEAK